MTDVRALPVGEGNEEMQVTLDQLAREGARRMIAAGWRAEHERFWREEVFPSRPSEPGPILDDDSLVVIQWFRLDALVFPADVR